MNHVARNRDFGGHGRREERPVGEPETRNAAGRRHKGPAAPYGALRR